MQVIRCESCWGRQRHWQLAQVACTSFVTLRPILSIFVLDLAVWLRKERHHLLYIGTRRTCKLYSSTQLPVHLLVAYRVGKSILGLWNRRQVFILVNLCSLGVQLGRANPAILAMWWITFRCILQSRSFRKNHPNSDFVYGWQDVCQEVISELVFGSN